MALFNRSMLVPIPTPRLGLKLTEEPAIGAKHHDSVVQAASLALTQAGELEGTYQTQGARYGDATEPEFAEYWKRALALGTAFAVVQARLGWTPRGAAKERSMDARIVCGMARFAAVLIEDNSGRNEPYERFLDLWLSYGMVVGFMSWHVGRSAADRHIPRL